jgi:hypothetical protein
MDKEGSKEDTHRHTLPGVRQGSEINSIDIVDILDTERGYM